MTEPYSSLPLSSISHETMILIIKYVVNVVANIHAPAMQAIVSCEDPIIMSRLKTVELYIFTHANTHTEAQFKRIWG